MPATNHRDCRDGRWRCLIVLLTLCLAPQPLHGRETPQGSHARVSEAGCSLRDALFSHGERASHDVALTFDACPTRHVPPFAPEIVDALVKAEVPATFFVSGKWAEAHPDDLHILSAVPFFAIGTHGYRHRRLNGASDQVILAEIDDGRRALEQLGVRPLALFRPPYGDHPPGLVGLARRAGVTPVLWDVAPGDPSPQETAADIERDVLRRTRGGSIIVLHVNGRGVGTAAAVPKLIAQLRERGFRFVTVAELLRECDPAPAGADPLRSTP